MNKVERDLNEILKSKGVKYNEDNYLMVKHLKRICIYHFGLGFIFASPKVRSILYESEIDLLDWICKANVDNEKKGKK